MQAPDWAEHRFSGAFCLLFSFSTLSRTLADDFRPAVFAGRARGSGCKLQIGRSIASAVHFACSSVFQPLAERSPMIFDPAVFAGRASVSGCRLQIGWSTASAVHFACPLVFQPLAERSPMIFDPPSLRAGRA